MTNKRTWIPNPRGRPEGNPGNKGGGKPADPVEGPQTKAVLVKMTPGLLARLDATRGSVPRSAWVRLAVLSALEDAQTRREIYPTV